MMRRYTRQLLQFDKIFDKHAVHALLAYEFNDYMGKSVTATGIGFVPGFQILDVTAKPEATKGGISEWAVQSLFPILHMHTIINTWLKCLSVVTELQTLETMQSMEISFP